MKKVRVANILICVLLFSISNKSIIAQEESTKVIKKNSISVEGIYYHGYISCYKDFDIFINYSRIIFNTNYYTLSGEIGIGLPDICYMLTYVPIRINLKNYIGKNKHKAVFGLGCLYTCDAGIYIPIILGYKYDIINNLSGELNLNLPLSFSYSGDVELDRAHFWLWEKDSYNDYLISLGLRYNF